MRRDSIFYHLFQRSPSLLFDLIPDPPENANAYRFDSVAVKEPKFEIDGVFLPPEDEPGVVYFVEVQFQKDERFYERVCAESMLYFYRNREQFTDWQIVIIYPSRKTEQSETFPYRSFINSDQMLRIYIDELGDIQELPLWISLVVLTTVTEARAVEEAKGLIQRAQSVPLSEGRIIIETIVTIISYRFDQISRQEVEEMLDISFKETRVYQEITEEARRVGLEQGLERGLEQGLERGLEQGLERGLEQGLERGRREATARLTMRQLMKRFGELSEDMSAAIAALPLTTLESLSEALIDFQSVSDAQIWLDQNKTQETEE